MLEDLIADEQVAVTVSHGGYLKRTPISTYRMQRRGGTGRTGMKTRDEDFVEHLFIASTHAYILIFTNTGRVYWLKVYEIPDVSAAGKGKHVGNLVALQPGETVRTMLAVRNLEEEGRYIFFATRNGTVKKTELKDFSHVMSRGIIAIGIEKGDELVGVTLTDGNQIVFLASHDGQAIRFEEDDVRSMGRPAFGVRGMKLDKGDYIVGMAMTPKDVKKAEEDAQKAKAKAGVAEATATDEIHSYQGLAHSVRDRKRLRQTHPRRRISSARTRRLRRDQRQDHRTQRQSDRHRAGDRRLRSDADQPVRQNHPHGFEHHSRIRPRRARRAAVTARAGRPRGGSGGDPARRRAKRKRNADSITAHVGADALVRPVERSR